MSKTQWSTNQPLDSTQDPYDSSTDTYDSLATSYDGINPALEQPSQTQWTPVAP